MDTSAREGQKSEEEIRQIHRELVAARDNLQELEQKSRKAQAEQPELECRVDKLRRRLSEIREENAEDHRRIEEMRSERAKLSQITQHLKGLEAHFVSLNTSFGAANVPNLKKEDEEKVLSLLDDVISRVSREHGVFREDECEQTINALQEENDEVDRQLQVLEQIEGNNWDRDNTLEVTIDDFCEQFPQRELHKGNGLSEIQVPRASDEHKVSEVVNKVELPKAPNIVELRRNLASGIKELKEKRQREIAAYQDQLEYLETLKELLQRQQNGKSFDAGRFQAQMSKRIRMLGQIETMAPIQLPEGGASESDPAQLLAAQFTALYEELKQNTHNGCSVADLEYAAKQTLEPPKGVIPNDPNHVVSPTASHQLAVFTQELRELSDTVRNFVPIQAVQKLVASLRAALEAVPLEGANEPSTSISVASVASSVHIGGQKATEPEYLREFRESVAAKVPAKFASRLYQIDGKVPELEVPAPPPSDVTVDENSGPDYTAEINALLRVFAALELPATPTLPQTPTEHEKQGGSIDTSPVTDALTRALDPAQVKARFLRSEITELERNLAELVGTESTPEDVEEVTDATLASLRAEIQRIKDTEVQYKQKISTLRELDDQKKQLTKQNADLEAEINAEGDIDQELEEKEKELGQKRDELARRRSDFEEEQKLRIQLMQLKA